MKILALDHHIGGALLGPSSYFMKSPPEQYTDGVCKAKVEQFIAVYDQRTAKELEAVSSIR